MSAIAKNGVRGWSWSVFANRRTWFGLLFLAVWSLFVAGCGGDDSSEPPTTQPDATTDAKRDATPDAVGDRADAPLDVRSEGDAVATPDGDATVTPDVRVDVTPEAEAAAPDVRVDAIPDAVPDVPSDRVDTGTVDAQPDRGPDAVVDARPDVVEAGPVTLTAIDVTPSTPSIAKGTTQPFAATGRYSNGTTQILTNTVTWTSSQTGVATINAAGLATSPNNGTIGTTTISAQSGTVTGSTVLTVTAATLSSVAVTPTTPSIADGTTVQLTATGTYSDQSTQNLTGAATWASPTVAVATVNGTGLVTGQGTGDAVVSATVNGVVGSTTVTVTNANLVSISISPGAPSIAPTTSVQFSATGIYSNGTTQDLTQTATWGSTSGAVATVGDTAGTKGFANALTTGQTTISATVTTTAGDVVGNTLLTVTNATLNSIAVTTPTPSIANGRTAQFTATGTFSDLTTQNITASVTWDSSDITKATISNVLATKGQAKGVGVGSTTITATLGTVSGTAALTVSTAVLQSIAVTPPTPSIAKGSTQPFVATGTFSDATTQTLTTSVTWSSSAPGVASISNAGGSHGLATGLSVGGATITATLNGIAGSTSITITAATLLTIAVTPPTPSIAKGTSAQFTAIGTYTDNSTQDLTTTVAWSSSDTTVSTISSSVPDDGKASGDNIGTSTITATLGTVSGNTLLTVTSANLVGIDISPSSPSIAKGTTQPFTATGRYSDGTTQILTTTVTWSSTDGAVATISSASGTQGVATAVSQGSTTIQATQGSVSGSASLTVTPAVLASIAVTPTNPSIAKGTQKQFTATGTYSDNTTQDLTQSVTWGSSDGTKASVSNVGGSRGLATGLGVGSSVISAASGTISGNTTLTVTAATLQSVSVTPVNQTIAKGTELQFTAIGTYSDGTVQDLTTTATWASSTANATISNAALSQGLAKGQALGSTVISATVITTGLPDVVGSTALNVTIETLVSIAVTPDAPTIANGTSQQFIAIGTYTDNSHQTLTTQVTWQSSATNVAVILTSGAAKGLATATGVGMTNITATLSGKTGTTVLHVSAATLDTITISPDPATIANGTKQQFTATGHYSDSTTQILTTSVTWAALPAGVATISNAAGSEGEATSVSPGSTTISATLSGTSASTTLTVTNAMLTSIDVLPLNRNAGIGQKVQYSAIGHFTSGPTQNLTTQVAWQSSNIGVAIISNTSPKGEATAVGNGSTTISAFLSGINGSTGLLVAP